jgi:hypothetical protein
MSEYNVLAPLQAPHDLNACTSPEIVHKLELGYRTDHGFESLQLSREGTYL